METVKWTEVFLSWDQTFFFWLALDKIGHGTCGAMTFKQMPAGRPTWTRRWKTLSQRSQTRKQKQQQQRKTGSVIKSASWPSAGKTSIGHITHPHTHTQAFCPSEAFETDTLGSYPEVFFFIVFVSVGSSTLEETKETQVAKCECVCVCVF